MGRASNHLYSPFLLATIRLNLATHAAALAQTCVIAFTGFTAELVLVHVKPLQRVRVLLLLSVLKPGVLHYLLDHALVQSVVNGLEARLLDLPNEVLVRLRGQGVHIWPLFILVSVLIAATFKVLLDLNAGLHSIHDGHVDVKHDCVVVRGRFRLDRVDCLKTILHRVNLIEVRAQPLLEGVQQKVVVIGEQAVGRVRFVLRHSEGVVV